MTKSDEPPFSAVAPPSPRKRPYSAPKVTEYGHVAKLTAGGSGIEAEGSSGMLGMN